MGNVYTCLYFYVYSVIIECEQKYEKSEHSINDLETYAFDIWHKQLSDEEKQAIRYYTEAGAEVINEVLNTANADITPRLQAYIDHISSAIHKFDLKQDISVFRGVKREEYEQIKRNSHNVLKTFMSFKSTTLDETLATRWTTKENINYDTMIVDGRYVLIVQVPRTARGAYIEPITANPGEKEFILDKQTCYSVLDEIEHNEIRYLILGVE
ncbi:ADP-ribosyltransferase [Staphylococcus pettenkoferi]|uniref:ADP-ribosyltransferase n=1 Tax=Staphylococcus pettenkoferi TaxID=170573 RepID=UPI002272D4F8|nr:ADP-ribosyltransferase [Staphylococcus pettenkoferi]MCY1563826.1 ADP-ribosyltransferase [Staphylococcus pettenkoferi]